METIFPEAPGFNGMFIVGFRKDPGGSAQTQRLGSVILKRTYAVDAITGELTPAETALPVFTKDQPENLAVNGAFAIAEANEDGTLVPSAWEIEEGLAVSLREEAGDTLLSLDGGDGSQALRQPVELEISLGGRDFALSLEARTEAPGAHWGEVHLEAEGADPICVVSGAVGSILTRFEAVGTFPADIDVKRFDIILRPALSGGAPVTTLVTRVQVEERKVATPWKEENGFTMHREHDLAPFKPEGDLVVRGFNEVPAPCSLEIGGTVVLSRGSTADAARSLFGWEPRVDSAREGEAGAFSSDPEAYPPEWPVVDAVRDPLPTDFNNRFYNGYLRDARSSGTPVPYPAEGAVASVIRNGSVDYRVRLPRETFETAFLVYAGSGDDVEELWQRHALALTLDTFVLEPEVDRCSAVWRASWDFDTFNEDAYRKLEVKSSI